MQLLQKSGYKIQIGDLKALLKELGYNWNGPSCSIQQLLGKLKEYLNPHLAASSIRPTSQHTAIVGQKLKFQSD